MSDALSDHVDRLRGTLLGLAVGDALGAAVEFHMPGSFDPAGDPLGFFLWDEFIDPGKPYQCPSCGRLLDDDTSKWNDDRQCHVIECPDCHALVRVYSREHGP